MCYNEDLAACINNKCELRYNCLRWQLAQNNDPYQTCIVKNDTDGCDLFTQADQSN